MVIHSHPIVQVRSENELGCHYNNYNTFFFPDANDFNISTITTIFPSDEIGTVVIDVNVPIPVFYDLIDEASDQFFVAELRVVDGINTSLIRLAQRVSRCQIVDNDCT